MKRKHERAPVSLYRRVNGIYYARKWDAEEGKYTDARSTGQRRKGPAFAAGLKMFEAGELRAQAGDPLLVDFLVDYWKRTPRVRSAHYRAESVRIVETHVAGFAQLAKLRRSRVRGFHLNRLRDYLETEAACKGPDGKVRRGLSARMTNRSLQAVLVPLRWAWKRGHIAADPTPQAERAKERFRERGILSLDEMQKIIGLDCRGDGTRARTPQGTYAESAGVDLRQKAAVLLGALAGLRRGELRALRWEDVTLKASAAAGPMIRVTRSYVDEDGFKEPKADSGREVPLCAPLLACLLAVREASPWKEPADLVLYNVERGKPMPEVTIRRGFGEILQAIGITDAERERRHLVFHGLRHFYVSLARTVLPDFAVRRLSGHASQSMLENYSHTAGVVDFDAARVAIDGKLRGGPR